MDGSTKLRLRSVPHVDTDRLLARLRFLHDGFHTPHGLHAFDGPRRSLIDNGRIMIAIRDELAKRGVSHDLVCRFCNPL